MYRRGGEGGSTGPCEKRKKGLGGKQFSGYCMDVMCYIRNRLVLRDVKGGNKRGGGDLMPAKCRERKKGEKR